MQILAVDVGTGTQDILLFDSARSPENCLKLVMPSPTMLVASAIRQATAAAHTLLLTGVTMGGGPSSWATEDHHRAGLPIPATHDRRVQLMAALGVHDGTLAGVETGRFLQHPNRGDHRRVGVGTGSQLLGPGPQRRLQIRPDRRLGGRVQIAAQDGAGSAMNQQDGFGRPNRH